MQLRELLQGLCYTGGESDWQVSMPVRDSRQVVSDCIFFCIKGVQSDGHDYATLAIEMGARGVVVQQDMGLSAQIIVEDTHYAYAVACANYFGNPAKQLKLLGVTGTNGKTTISWLAKQMIESAGKKVGLIGTVGNQIDQVLLPAKHTTPDPFQLHSLFSRMVKAGCEYAVMEVSSHALDQNRVTGCHFAVSAFTNLTQDHLDYHHTLENYFQAKKKLFDISDCGWINCDDSYGMRLEEELQIPHFGYSCQNSKADLWASEIHFTQRGSSFTLHYQAQQAKISFVQPGMYSVSNALAAAGLLLTVGFSFSQVVKGLQACTGVPGRLETIPAPVNYTIMRDYAHSPDGLEKLLSTLREVSQGRIVTLFGCAGLRDRSKRPAMAEIVSRFSDCCILTSDNPRQEDEWQIIQDAVTGFQEHPKVLHREFTDRLEALQWALDYCQEDDLLVLAGKGHEDYQVLRDRTIYFDEKEIVQRLLCQS